MPRSEGEGRGASGFNVATHGLRGVASAMVFLAHLLGGTAEHVYASREGYVEGIRPFWNVGTFGVDLFFVISGFVILPSALRYGPLDFAKRRFLRLYPLFLACTLLFMALNAATDLRPAAQSPVAVVSALLFLDIFTPTEQLTPNAWSLTFEVWFYILTVAGVAAILRRPSALRRGLFALAAGLFVAAYPIALYFLAGIAVRLLHDRHESIRVGRRPLVEIALLSACLILAAQGHYEYRWSDFADPVVPLLMAATAGYFLLAASRNSVTAGILSSPVPIWLGTVSYSLYLVHPYIYFVLRESFSRAHLFGPNIVLSMTVFIATTAAATFAATALAHRWLEFWPYERVFGQSVYRIGGPEGPPRKSGPFRQRVSWIRSFRYGTRRRQADAGVSDRSLREGRSST